MPVTSAVITLKPDGAGSAGDHVRAVKAGRSEAADLLVVPVGADGALAVDETLDSVLGVSPVDVVAAAQLSGAAGQVASAVAKLGDAVLRVLFVGVGDRSASDLRRAGGADVDAPDKTCDVSPLVPPGAQYLGRRRGDRLRDRIRHQAATQLADR